MVTTRSMSRKARAKASTMQSATPVPSKEREPAANWSNLPDGLLTMIAECLTCYADYEVMWVVCRNWRLARKGAKYRGSSSQPPWLLTGTVDNSDENKNVARFVIHRTSNCTLPEEFRKGNNYVKLKIPVEISGVRCLSSKGWMMVAPESAPLSLFNPFSGHVIDIPNMKRSKGDTDSHLPFVQKFVMSSSPSVSDDYWVMIISGKRSHPAIWRPGDPSWTKIGLVYPDSQLTDAIFYGGKFYAISTYYEVYCYVPGRKPYIMKYLGLTRHWYPNIRISMLYMVELDGKLVVAARGSTVNTQRPQEYTTFKFWLRELKFKDDGTFEYDLRRVKVKSLGNKALFLGDNESFSVDAMERSWCRPDHIYFTDNVWLHWYPAPVHGGGKDNGIFKLKEYHIAVFLAGDSNVQFNRTSFPLWIEPRC